MACCRFAIVGAMLAVAVSGCGSDGTGATGNPTDPFPTGTGSGACAAPSREESVSAMSPAFELACAGCHGPNAEGMAAFPALPTGSTSTLEAFRRVIRTGVHRTTNYVMPSFDATRYDDAALEQDFAFLSSTPPSERAAMASSRLGPELGRAMEASAIESALAAGLPLWRKTSATGKGACASCHGPAALDLARIKYRDSDILRRCTGNGLTGEECQTIVAFVHATRAKHEMRDFCRPGDGFLQPGNARLHGDSPEALDQALLAELEGKGLPLATRDVATRTDYEEMVAAIGRIQLFDVRVGFDMNRWTSDGVFGDDRLSSREWIPDYPSEPKDATKADWYDLHDQYIASPSSDTLWKIMLAQREMTSAAPMYTGPDFSVLAEDLKDRIAAGTTGLMGDAYEAKAMEVTQAWAAEVTATYNLPYPLMNNGGGTRHLRLTESFLEWQKRRYAAVLSVQEILRTNRVEVLEPPSFVPVQERERKGYGAQAIWDIGDMLIVGCLTGCYQPRWFMNDMMPALDDTRMRISQEEFYKDTAGNAHLWPFLASLIDLGEQQLKVSNEYYFNNFGSENHVAHEMRIHQLWQRAVVMFGSLYFWNRDAHFAGKTRKRNNSAPLVGFGGPVRLLLDGRVHTSDQSAFDAPYRAEATRFGTNLIRMSIFAAQDLCASPNEFDRCVLDSPAEACQGLQTNYPEQFAGIAQACQDVQRCFEACPQR